MVGEGGGWEKDREGKEASVRDTGSNRFMMMAHGEAPGSVGSQRENRTVEPSCVLCRKEQAWQGQQVSGGLFECQ